VISTISICIPSVVITFLSILSFYLLLSKWSWWYRCSISLHNNLIDFKWLFFGLNCFLRRIFTLKLHRSSEIIDFIIRRHSSKSMREMAADLLNIVQFRWNMEDKYLIFGLTLRRYHARSYSRRVGIVVTIIIRFW